MIDAERWVLAEAWIANGLRLRWASGYNSVPREQLQGDRPYYWYAGYGEWMIIRETRGFETFGPVEAPQMATADMRHELAHWLVSTEEERTKVNFGMTKDSDDAERRAIEAESVISAIVNGASRVATIALGGPK